MAGSPTQSTARRRLPALLLAVVGLVLGVATPAQAFDTVNINFQPSTFATPVGWTADSGAAYSTTTGRGWVREDSISKPSTQHAGLNLTSRTRDRGIPADKPTHRTFMIAEGGAPLVRGAYEYAVPAGRYKVTVGMGDYGAYDSTYAAEIEGQTLISPFTPSSTAPEVEQTGCVNVSDGRLTVSELAGSNGKFQYLTIADCSDTTAPAPPKALAVTPGTSQIGLSWTANTESDLAGYRVYRSTTTPVAVGTKANPGSPISGSSLVTGAFYNDTTVTNGTKYYYAVVAVDTSGNVSTSSACDDTGANCTAEPSGTATAPVNSFNLKVDFKTAAAPLPSTGGYLADVGSSYDATRGFGWVTEPSLSIPDSTQHVPLDATDRARYRTNPTDPDKRLATFVQMSKAGAPTGAWEATVPNGKYNVTVAAGDPAAFDSTYKINVEGVNAINYTPANSTAARSVTATVQNVLVSDGRLTIDNIGGTNGKLQYVDIAATTGGPPAPPANVAASGDTTAVHATWAPNAETDLAGYRVFRGVDTTPANATQISPANALLTSTSFDDTTATPGTAYYYFVYAVNTAAQSSLSSNPTPGTRPIEQKDLKFDFAPSSAAVPVGYTRDTGGGYLASRGYGWITQQTLTTTHTPVDMSTYARVRNLVADQRLDSFIHMQPLDANGNPKVSAAWEAAVPNGSYDVTVAVGDANAIDSVHDINVEGQPLITDFIPTAKSHFDTESTTVNVTDNRLTIDSIGGKNTKIDYVTIKTADAGTRPSVGDVSPKNGATLVSRSRAITAEVNLPNVGAGVDEATLTNDSVRLIRVSDGSQVAANLNTSGGGDVIVLQPRAALAAQTQYRFEVNQGLKDVSGATFIPSSSTFTTGDSTSNVNNIARFLKYPQSAGAGELMASLTIGPDNRLYVTTLDGKILRFPIDPDTGTLGDPTTITTIIDHENGPRHILGLAFDPASTPDNLILWVTTGSPEFANAPDWTGKITRLSGPDLSVADDYVTGLPRSARDHETNSLAFHDGKLYVTQGSESATGEPDVQWGLRQEHLLSGAVLQVDTAAITSPPLNVKTDDGGTYDPFAPGAPVTVYASGIRNAYDLVWHSNGQLYVPTNGSAANGNTPATPATLPATCQHRIDFDTFGPFTPQQVPSIQHLGVQPDLLFRVQQGGYYGHPNPSRCEYTFFGGNPTTQADPLETVNYPVGTMPDRNWRQPSWNFGNHFSPNGAIEYKSDKFGGRLNGDLLVARYSAGDDIVALPLDPTTKEATDQLDGIPGLGGLDNPLDITEDQRNGNLYVTELSETMPKITLIKPDETDGAPKASLTPSKTIQSAVVNTQSGDTTVTLRNTGNKQLRLNAVGIDPSSPDASQFVLDHVPAVPLLIDPDQETTIDVKFAPTSVGVKSAQLTVTTDDPSSPTTSINLRGLGTAGETGSAEPSLQRILDTYQYNVNVGDDNPDESTLPAGASLGQEVPIQAFHKAGTGKVTIEPLAVYANQGDGTTVGSFGWNELNDNSPDDLSTIATIPNSQAQTLAPQVTGALSFDPDVSSFGFWSKWSYFQDRTVFTQDSINTFPSTPSHQARGYQLRDASGTVIPNAYIVAFEATSPVQDFQDLVFVVRNVQPDGSGAGKITLQGQDGAPFDDHMVFNRIGSLASPPANVVHDKSTVRLFNTGSTPLDVTNLSVTGPFAIDNASTLPKTLAPNSSLSAGGAYLDVRVKFLAESGRVSNGTLTINSTSALTPSVQVSLAGYWQAEEQGSYEPHLAELLGMFGFGTVVTKPGQTLNQHGQVAAVGDEVISPYWRRADPSKSVRVTQLSAFHGPGGSVFSYFLRGGDRTSALIKDQLQMNSAEYQSMLPHKNGSSTAIASTTIATLPNEFGFSMGNHPGEFSDPSFNNQTGDLAGGCTAPCGHHVRMWPAKTPSGQLMANTYIVTMDYSAATATNYDYNDNTYLVTNITPDTNTDTLLYRVDTGATSSFTDTSGRVWSPDAGFYSPPNAISEPADAHAGEILNTQDDKLFQTYRGNVGASVPQANRILSYRFPTRTATKVRVVLDLVERTWTTTGKRVFNVSAEGVPYITGLDIFKEAGGKDVAWTRAINNIPVSDGALDLDFSATTDFPAIAGIEVYCTETCGSD